MDLEVLRDDLDGTGDDASGTFEAGLRDLLVEIGEDPRRSGLRATPRRIHRMYGELTSGYRVDVGALVEGATFDVAYDEMVLVRDIEFYSLCEHHLLPFWGRAHVGYLPKGRIIGLSKIPRIVEAHARRLQVQERLTNEIARVLMDGLEPKGVGCVVEAAHLCTMMRGVRNGSTRMVTSAMLGTFRRDQRTRGEFLALIGRESGPPR